jgi:hypothetical protein
MKFEDMKSYKDKMFRDRVRYYLKGVNFHIMVYTFYHYDHKTNTQHLCWSGHMIIKLDNNEPLSFEAPVRKTPRGVFNNLIEQLYRLSRFEARI